MKFDKQEIALTLGLAGLAVLVIALGRLDVIPVFWSNLLLAALVVTSLSFGVKRWVSTSKPENESHEPV